jgi:hypothetical protein
MIPKEKADSIFQQMYKILWHTNSDPIHCKQCAIVAVDEILKAGKDVDEFADNYWLQVKTEIEKL